MKAFVAWLSMEFLLIAFGLAFELRDLAALSWAVMLLVWTLCGLVKFCVFLARCAPPIDPPTAGGAGA